MKRNVESILARIMPLLPAGTKPLPDPKLTYQYDCLHDKAMKRKKSRINIGHGHGLLPASQNNEKYCLLA